MQRLAKNIMVTSEFWQRVSASVSSPDWAGGANKKTSRVSRGTSKFWMLLDAITVFGAAVLATLYEFKISPIAEVRSFWRGTLIQGRSIGILLALLCGYIVSLIIISLRLHLYSPARLGGYLNEQRLTVQACFTAGLLLVGTLYLVHADDIPRRIVVVTWGLVLVSLSIRRLVYRMLLYRRFERGLGTRNILIAGAGPEAHALRHHVESIRHLGYSFKGFVEMHGSASLLVSPLGDIVGALDSLFTHARKHFVDEIFLMGPCEPGIVQDMLDKARAAGVDLRVVPDMYDGLAWNSPIEYIGQFPTIPLNSGRVPEMSLVLKRWLDIVCSLLVLIGFAPLLVAIAIAIKLPNPEANRQHRRVAGAMTRVISQPDSELQSNRPGVTPDLFRCPRSCGVVSEGQLVSCILATAAEYVQRLAYPTPSNPEFTLVDPVASVSVLADL